MSISQEREDASRAIDEAMATVRLNTAILRDTMPTKAEQDAKMDAFLECLALEGS